MKNIIRYIISNVAGVCTLGVACCTATPLVEVIINEQNSSRQNFNNRPQVDFKYENTKNIVVSDANSLAIAVSSACDGTVIKCSDDICLDRTVQIKNSVTIDLNGHSIIMVDGAKIVVGDKIFDHIEYYTVHHSGHYMPNYSKTYVTQEDGTKKVVSETKNMVWQPGWDEQKSREIYNYLDHIDIVVKNGKILGSDGKNGQDGVANTFFDCDGKDGENGGSAIEIISGTIRVQNAFIIGGNGGNGGDGDYQAILHIPFFTGNGGNGGKGGDAGSAVVLKRKEARVLSDDYSLIQSGTYGEGGNGGEANQNHWVGHGKMGIAGKNGQKASAVKEEF